MLMGLLIACSVMTVPLTSDTLRVMVWNVERGSNPYVEGPEKTLRIIREVNPDVVLMQESYDIDGDRPELGRWLAKELGWSEYQDTSPHLSVLTRLKIQKTFLHANWHGVGATLRDSTGRDLIAYSIWIDWREYVPDELKANPDLTDEQLLRMESEGSQRLAQTQDLIKHWRERSHMSAAVPLLIGGDWNCPSHLDWTEATAKAFPYRRAIPLPVSQLMHDTGFRDAFRLVHPDPVTHPGNTWSPLLRYDADGKEEPWDRIDRLYIKNPESGWRLVPVAARVLPDPLEDPSIPQRDRMFPSDHSAVVIDFRWES